MLGGESKLATDDILIGFGGGILKVFWGLSVGGCGGAYFGRSGTLAGTRLATGIHDAEALVPVGGGFNGEIGGGFEKVRSCSCREMNDEGGFGGGTGGGWSRRLLRSPTNSGGGRINVSGGGGGAMDGGGGTKISPSF